MTATGKLRAVVVLVAALMLAGLTARLGFWQLDRASQKRQLHDAQVTQRGLPTLIEAELARSPAQAFDQRHRLVQIEGQWLGAYTIYLDNRLMNGQAGFYAVTPLRLADDSVVLVQRGWVPRDRVDRTRIVLPAPPAGRVQVLGRVAPALGRLYEFDATPSGTIRQNLDIDGFARESGLPLRPVAVVQEDGDKPPQDGLQRQWPKPAADLQKHHGYAFQWFALSALTITLYVWFQVIRPRRRRAA
jgi:surfeit locus 1 family protein